MSPWPFTFRQLEIFKLLCETHSFRRCAEMLGVSQASVSNQLRSLEEQMGLSLLDRSPGKRPRLTDKGEEFLADLQNFQIAAQNLAAHRRSGAAPHRRPGHFYVLAGQYLMQTHIKPQLAALYQRNPQISLDFDSKVPTDRIVDELQSSTYDIAVIHVPLRLKLGNDFREISHVTAGIYGAKRFIADQPLPLTAEQIRKLPFVLPPENTLAESVILEELSRHAIKPSNIIARTGPSSIMVEMIVHGMAVGPTLEPLLPSSSRDNVQLLWPLTDFKLVSYCPRRGKDALLDEAEQFLIDTVIRDPTYPYLPIEA
ncbi:LysR family transcriptional regulator [Altericroceibacterium endophyticum]|uniref:LysR family transcriptional regulator n=1 Tax=Altericroceibacterium endophyticum TaxID=1808508 RepID=A0A6I4T821_9SPHN|nr:LysR family transcriptional regulator [Altericroceibacterium endophyticum]MXO66153.1 LysR family transcriptional regulator [Altericroceibacterium endophyticum]